LTQRLAVFINNVLTDVVAVMELVFWYEKFVAARKFGMKDCYMDIRFASLYLIQPKIQSSTNSDGAQRVPICNIWDVFKMNN